MGLRAGLDGCGKSRLHHDTNPRLCSPEQVALLTELLPAARKETEAAEYRIMRRFTIFIKVNVKWSRYRPDVAQRVGRGIVLVFHDRGTRRGEWSAARPGRTLPPGKNRYAFYGRLGGPQGRSARAENLVPTGIRSRTVQPVAQSLYWLSYRAHSRCLFLFTFNSGNHMKVVEWDVWQL